LLLIKFGVGFGDESCDPKFCQNWPSHCFHVFSKKITIEKNGVFFSFKWFIFDFSQDNLFNNSISIRIRIRTFFRMLIRILSNLSDLDPQHWIEGCKKRYLLPIPYTSKYRPTELYGIQYIPIKITGRYLV
jgi:hypothetical protein